MLNIEKYENQALLENGEAIKSGTMIEVSDYKDSPTWYKKRFIGYCDGKFWCVSGVRNTALAWNYARLCGNCDE